MIFSKKTKDSMVKEILQKLREEDADGLPKIADELTSIVNDIQAQYDAEAEAKKKKDLAEKAEKTARATANSAIYNALLAYGKEAGKPDYSAKNFKGNDFIALFDSFIDLAAALDKLDWKELKDAAHAEGHESASFGDALWSQFEDILPF